MRVFWGQAFRLPPVTAPGGSCRGSARMARIRKLSPCQPARTGRKSHEHFVGPGLSACRRASARRFTSEEFLPLTPFAQIEPITQSPTPQQQERQ